MMTDNGRLIGERTLSPEEAIPTLFLPPTTTPVIVPTAIPTVNPTGIPTEVAGLPIATAQNNFIVVSPTLLPSKTVTTTPTQSPIPQVTTTPTITVTATATATSQQFSFRGDDRQSSAAEATAYAINLAAQQDRSTQQVISSQNAFVPPAGQPNQQNAGIERRPAAECTEIQWFAQELLVETCPNALPESTNAAFQRFQYGYMFWLEQTDRIYVFFTSVGVPGWADFADPWNDDLQVCRGEQAVNVANQQAWTPVQGFCMVWSNNDNVKSRIGYAEDRFEFSYVARYQIGEEGSIAIEDNLGNVFYTGPSGLWSLFIR
jgi:hypothetical protein